jgi:hypothetical protein
MEHRPDTGTAEERERVLCCLRRWSPPRPGSPPRSDVLDDVLAAYGDLDTLTICLLIRDYARAHASELDALLDRQERDPRRPAVLSDPALMCVLERLEHDRYALRRSWVSAHDPRELRRVADLWGVRLGA